MHLGYLEVKVVMMMFHENVYYNNYARYQYNPYAYSYYTPSYNPTFYNPIFNNSVGDPIEDIPSTDTTKTNNTNGNRDVKNESSDTTSGIPEFRLGPLEYTNNRISLFGFSMDLDDLIIMVLMFLLLVESDCDYSLLIVLGLLLFNINFSTLDKLNIFS